LVEIAEFVFLDTVLKETADFSVLPRKPASVTYNIQADGGGRGAGGVRVVVGGEGRVRVGGGCCTL
jgi:hypothetical protein